MRHGKRFNHLGRTASHRKAMLSNMAISLIKHKRITTTLAKAKALRQYVEPLITKSKDDTTHSRRTVFSYLQDKEAVTILFREISEKVATRPGGYTRIIKLENRLGDNAEMAFIELVDYNEVYKKDGEATERKSTRRRGGKKKTSAAAPVADETTEVVVDEKPTAKEEVAVEETVAEVEETAVETEAAPAVDNEAETQKEESQEEGKEEKKD